MSPCFEISVTARVAHSYADLRGHSGFLRQGGIPFLEGPALWNTFNFIFSIARSENVTPTRLSTSVIESSASSEQLIAEFVAEYDAKTSPPTTLRSASGDEVSINSARKRSVNFGEVRIEIAPRYTRRDAPPGVSSARFRRHSRTGFGWIRNM